MKATQSNFAKVAAQAAGEARIFFFCGPDEAGAWQAAERILSLLSDPGEAIELAGGDLKKDPVRLADEAHSTSLFGDARHILVRAQGDEAHDAVQNLIASDVEPSPVLIVATGATDKSRTAKLLANRPDALVAMFYPPDLQSIAASVRKMADESGLRIDTGVAERIARGANMDIRLARSEVEKLALYLDAGPEGPRNAGHEELDAIGAQSEDDGFAQLVDAALSGDVKRLPHELRRFREHGTNAVAILLAFERRAAQLAAMASRLGGGGNISALLDSERASRRVFWKDVPMLKIQLGKWRGKRLERLVEKLAGLHQAMLANSQDAELLLAQGIAEIARAAARKA
ncbi:MAG: DNA polymerase III subunit delta [Sphingomonadaceae bacterium]|nr:DNA polymerase III subunit delta [Sphingomonadaceae bacterium]